MELTLEPGGVIAVACDHGGFGLKTHLLDCLKQWGLPAADLGTNGPAAVDYPQFAAAVAEGVRSGRFALGVLVCGSGIGMSIAANRFHGVRAALCTSAYMARMAREHNDANVLCLGERVIGSGEAGDILRAFLEGTFAAGRHQRRVSMIEDCGRGERK